MEINKPTLITCACQSPEHIMLADFDEDNNLVFLSVHLCPERNIFKRIWKAIKYIFGHICIYGTFDEFVIDNSNVNEFKEIVNFIK